MNVQRHPTIIQAGFGQLGQLFPKFTPTDSNHHILRQQYKSQQNFISNNKQCRKLRFYYQDLRRSCSAFPQADLAIFCLTPSIYSTLGYQQTYLDGLRHFLNSFETPPKSLLIISSTSVYGQRNGEVINEMTPAQPRSDTAKQLKAMEDEALSGIEQTVILRLAGIYGHERKRLSNKICTLLNSDPSKNNIPTLIQNSYTNRIHELDAARLVGALSNQLMSGTPLPSILIGKDYENLTTQQVYQRYADHLQVEIGENIRFQSTCGKLGKQLRTSVWSQLGIQPLFPKLYIDLD